MESGVNSENFVQQLSTPSHFIVIPNVNAYEMVLDHIYWTENGISTKM